MNTSPPIKNVLFFYSVLIAVVYAPLVGFFSTKGAPLYGVIQYFTSDTFYYLSIARHSAGKAFFTSDGFFPTNGFHPLWEFILVKLLGIEGVVSNHPEQIYLTILISLFLTVSGMILFGFVLRRLTGSFAISLLGAVPGFYYLIFSSVAPSYNSTWSFINGMESPLSIFFFGTFAFLAINKRVLLKPAWTTVIIPTLLTTLIIFSRLDDIFLLIPYLILVVIFSPSPKQALLRLAVSAGVPFTALLAYLFYNHSYAGSFLPVSGLIKQGNWLWVNLTFLLTTFLPAGLINPRVNWAETSMRALQMFVPAGLALFWLVRWLKTARNKTERQTWLDEHHDKIVIAAMAVYVVLKGAYNFTFVYIMGQGHWYFPLSIMIFNLMVSILLADFFRDRLAQAGKNAIGAGAILLVMLAANSFINHKTLGNYNLPYYKFWQSSERIESALTAIDPHIKIVEYDDGVMAYFLDIPAMNGFGFTLDREAYEAQHSGRLLELAYKRGFRVIGVMSYVHLSAQLGNDSDQIRRALQNMPGMNSENLDQWEFEILYRDPDSSAVFIRFEARR